MSSPTTVKNPTPRLTVPVIPEIAPQLVNFKPVIKSHTMLNAKPTPMETMFNGHMMTVPGRDQIHGMDAKGKLLPGSHADTDADGDPIPGSYVVEDRYEPDEMGQMVCVMDADQAVKKIFGITQRPDGTAAELSSNRALVGLSLIPRHSPKEVWQPVQKAGEHRAFLAAVKQAEYELEAFDLANALRKESGIGPKSPGPTVRHAIALVNQYNKLVGEEEQEFMAPQIEEQEANEAADAMKFEAFLKIRAMELVEEATADTNIDKTKAFDKLMQDPVIRKHAAKEWRYRRKGHLPLQDEEQDEE